MVFDTKCVTYINFESLDRFKLVYFSPARETCLVLVLGQVLKANLSFKLLSNSFELIKQWLYVEKLLFLDVSFFKYLIGRTEVV